MPTAMLAATPVDRSEPKCLVKPSKEWVVPPRPKPGRKSNKQEGAPAKSGGKTTQKAVRERRQEYVTELEDKVRQLEAGEGEKCVFFQQQAQKAKTESVALQQENDALKKEIGLLRRELERVQRVGRSVAPVTAGGAKDKGKGRASPRDGEDWASPGSSKRPRRSAAVRASYIVAEATGSSPVLHHAPPATAESPVPALSPAGTSSSSSRSAYVHSPLNDLQTVGPASPAHPQLALSEERSSSQHERCTFCPADDNCFCAQVGYEIAQTPHPPRDASSGWGARVKLEDSDDVLFAETSFEPAVPLRLGKSGTKASTVWAIEQPSAPAQRAAGAATEALCSGDPSNCPACSEDPSARWAAFCHAVFSTESFLASPAPSPAPAARSSPTSHLHSTLFSS